MAMKSIDIAITPYYDDLAKYGIHVQTENDGQISMKKLPWPRKRGHRKPSGGCDDAILNDPISFHQNSNELWMLNFNFTSNQKIVSPCSLQAKRLCHHEIQFFGTFYAQLDGDIAYVPENHVYDFLIIVCEDTHRPKHRLFRAIKFSKESSVQIDAFLIHSLPIPIIHEDNGIFNMNMRHRAVNAKSQFASPINIHIQTLHIEKLNFIPLKDLPYEDDTQQPRLPWHFGHRVLRLELANQFNLAEYGRLITDFKLHREQIRPLQWPYLKKTEKYSRIGALDQEFQMFWQDSEDKNFKFATIIEKTGNSDKQEQCSGIKYDIENNEYRVNILRSRPDGTFYIHAKDVNTVFAMIFALPDPLNGDPVEDTINVFLFQQGQAVRLHAGIWHSFPILSVTQNEAEFQQLVCETNTITTINLDYECCNGLKVRNDFSMDSMKLAENRKPTKIEFKSVCLEPEFVI